MTLALWASKRFYSINSRAGDPMTVTPSGTPPVA